jgi:hypothetical protein
MIMRKGKIHEEASADHHSHDGDEVSGSATHSHSETAETTHVHTDGTEHTHTAPANGPVGAAQALHDALSDGDAARVQGLLDSQVMIMKGATSRGHSRNMPPTTCLRI